MMEEKKDIQSLSLDEQVRLLKEAIYPNVGENELRFFLRVARSKGLDPFVRQVHLVKRFDSRSGKETITIQTGIDGFRLIAERTGDYAGQTPTQWCGADGVWQDVWLKSLPPAAAKVGVIRKTFAQPLYAVAIWTEYAQQTSIWKKMPSLMLAKVAEALALRKAFPQELGGLYTYEEIPLPKALDTEEIQEKEQEKLAPRDEVQKLLSIAKDSGVPIEDLMMKLHELAPERKTGAPLTILELKALKNYLALKQKNDEEP